MPYIDRRYIAILLAVFFGVEGCDQAEFEKEARVSIEEEDSSGDDTDQMMVSLMFKATLGTLPIQCGDRLQELGHEGVEIALRDFRVYLSEITLVNHEGDLTPLELIDDGMWQGDQVALLDFEDATEACSENGSAEVNQSIHGFVPKDEYTGVQFRFGIPQDLNHQDVARARPPLNVGSMFWVWQTGYKFMRLELNVTHREGSKPWLFHLGSTGCMSSAPTLAPEGRCQRVNRPLISLEGLDIRHDVIALDIASLLEGIEFGESMSDQTSNCMSSRAEARGCLTLFNHLGLDFESGEVEQMSRIAKVLR